MPKLLLTYRAGIREAVVMDTHVPVQVTVVPKGAGTYGTLVRLQAKMNHLAMLPHTLNMIKTLPTQVAEELF